MSFLPLSRRRMLKLSAAGSALLLPVLRSTRAEAATTLPKRLVFFHTPLGTIRENYAPTGTETAFNLSPILQPLSPFKNDLLVIDGIDFGTRAHNHHEPGAMLTGIYCSGADGTSQHTNISLDQYVKSKLPSSVPLKSLELMTFDRKPSRLDADRHLLSAGGPGLPVIPEGDPRAAFDRVFAGVVPGTGGGTTAVDPAVEALRADRRSVLDVVSKELTSLHGRLSAKERAKLDQHMTAIRELELRVAESGPADPAPTDPGAACTVPTRPAAQAVYENNTLPTRLKLNIEITAYAMACDQIRVAVLGNETGQGRASPIWVGFNSNWHDAFTHDTGGRAQHTAIHKWYVEQFAYLVGLFKSIPEGDGTMLDNTALVMFSEQGCRYLNLGSQYTHHSAKDLPFVVAGSCGGYFKQNRFVNAGGALYNKFLINCLHAMGYPESGFGKLSASPITSIIA